MLSTIRSVKGLTCRDIYFAQQAHVDAAQEDIQLFLQAATESGRCQPFVTSVVDLHHDESIITSGFKKSTAYDVRRAKEKDLAEAAIYDAPTCAEITDFCEFFDSFASAKGIGPSNRRKLALLAEANALSIALVTAKSSSLPVLAAHAYIVAEGRARLLYSATASHMASPSDRQLTGRANKYLHYEAVIHFKRRSLYMYDFGGLSKRGELRSIDEFKESFGGREIVEYNRTRGVTLKGKIAVCLLALVHQCRTLLQTFKKNR